MAGGFSAVACMANTDPVNDSPAITEYIRRRARESARVRVRPIAMGDKVEIRPMMYLALSYDHRIIDGREAVTFLVRVKECLEDPERILIDA